MHTNNSPIALTSVKLDRLKKINRTSTYLILDREPEAGQGDRRQLYLHQTRVGQQTLQHCQHRHGSDVYDYYYNRRS